jgi:hypothetical protein
LSALKFLKKEQQVTYKTFKNSHVPIAGKKFPNAENIKLHYNFKNESTQKKPFGVINAE